MELFLGIITWNDHPVISIIKKLIVQYIYIFYEFWQTILYSHYIVEKVFMTIQNYKYCDLFKITNFKNFNDANNLL